MQRNTCARSRALTGMLWLCLCTPAVSQPSPNAVRGEIKGPAADEYSQMVVELVDARHLSTPNRVFVQSDGSFDVDSVAPGQYTLLVKTLHGLVLHEQSIKVIPHGTIEVYLPEREVRHSGAATASVRQLLHPPSKKAIRSFMDAQKFSSSGNFTKATEALEQAVGDSPEYAEAHINLGAQYMRAGHFDDAKKEMERALEIAGPSSLILCNLAWIQVNQGKRAEALETVRAGLRLDQGSPQGNLILGVLLASDVRTRPEAIRHLERAAETLSTAQVLLDRLQTLR